MIGSNKHSHVCGIRFSPIPTSMFRAISRRKANATLKSNLKNTQEEELHFKDGEDNFERLIAFTSLDYRY